jgi:hypothetical protein
VDGGVGAVDALGEEDDFAVCVFQEDGVDGRAVVVRVWVVLVGFSLRGELVSLTVSVNGVLGVVFYADDLADVVFFVLRQRHGEVFPVYQQS